MSSTKAAIVAVQTREYDYDDTSSEYSSGADPSRQPLHDFGSPTTLVGEHLHLSPKSRTMGKLWKNSISMRARRKQSMDDVEQEVTDGLLGAAGSRRKSAKSRPWYIYCLFGGFGCLTLS